MTVRQQWAVVGAVVALLGGALFVATRVFSNELFPVNAGAEAPDFAAATIDATDAPVTRTLADYRGDVLLLNIWATWCLPCRVEMPSMQAAHERFAKHGLKVVGVSVDRDAGVDEIRGFRDEYKLTFEILHDPSGNIQQAYRTTGVPETFVIGRDGVIRKRVTGAADWDSPANQALIAQLLGIAPPPPSAPSGPIASFPARAPAAP